MILIVVSCIAAVYAFRWYLVYGMSAEWGTKWGGIIASFLNAVQIQILNIVYKVVIYLTVSLHMSKKKTDTKNEKTKTKLCNICSYLVYSDMPPVSTAVYNKQ